MNIRINEEKSIKICEHISISAEAYDNDNYEYQQELHIDCNVCKKRKELIVHIN